MIMKEKKKREKLYTNDWGDQIGTLSA